MKQFPVELTPSFIANFLDKKHSFVKDDKLDNVAELTEANNASVCFYENPKFLDDLRNSKAGLIFVPTDFDTDLKPSTNLIFVEKPYIYFMQFVRKWLELSETGRTPVISGSAKIHATAQIGNNINIGENCVIGANVIIADNVWIEANCVIEENCRVGSGSHFHSNCTIYHDTEIGKNVEIHSGVVIGADGFGYIFHEQKQHKIPQVGNVIIHDDVEIGANTTIDRSTLGSTVIGAGTKIDNLVQIGHNCKVGKNTIICAQTGVAGSTNIGNNVYLAGQVGIAGHLTIADGVMVGAQSGITKDIPEKAKYFGTPARDAGEMKRIMVSEKYLPDLVKDLKARRKKDRK